MANSTRPAEFLYDNLLKSTRPSFMPSRSLRGPGSSCTSEAPASTRGWQHQPMTEEQLLTSELEPTNEPYTIAKISGIKLSHSRIARQYGVQLHLGHADQPLRAE